MAECINCGKYTKYKNGRCTPCQEASKTAPIGEVVLTKKETKAITRSTPQALKIHEALRLKGIPSELEKWDHYKHIDIAITSSKINIEIDGEQHNKDENQALADLKRTYYSYEKGYFTLRIPNRVIDENLDEVIVWILKYIEVRKGRKD